MQELEKEDIVDEKFLIHSNFTETEDSDKVQFIH